MRLAPPLSGKSFWYANNNVVVRAFASKSKNSKQRRRQNSKNPTISPDSYWQRRIQELREQLAGAQSPQLNEEPPVLARTIAKRPYIDKSNLLTRAEFDQKVQDLNSQLVQWTQSLHKVEREWITAEIRLILKGQISIDELVGNIRSTLEQIKNPSDHAQVQDVLQWYKKTTLHGFAERFEKMFFQVSRDTQTILLAAHEPPMEDYKSQEQRVQETMLQALDPTTRKRFYLEKRDYCSRLYESEFIVGNGPSMLPSLRDPSTSQCKPLHPTPDQNMLDEINIGNVVSFVAFFNNGDAKFVTKRVLGLPGDNVETDNGKTVIVPDGHFWAVGDNRPQSCDSRHFGAVPFQNLKAKYILTYSWVPPFIRFL